MQMFSLVRAHALPMPSVFPQFGCDSTCCGETISFLIVFYHSMLGQLREAQLLSGRHARWRAT